MKELHEYETPETDKATCGIVDVMGAYTELTNPKTSRNLEQRLLMCRDVINGLLDCISETRGLDAYQAVENAKEALVITSPKLS